VTARIGVEIGVRTARAVRLEGLPFRRRVRLAEVTFEPGAVGEAVAALREQIGRAPRVAVAVDLPLLFAKHIKLPPVPADEKRRIVALEPERFFPIRGEELVVAARGGGDTLVFATREGPLAAWLAALEPLGPVELVEPGPVALARAAAAAGVARGSIIVDRDGAGVGIVEVDDARVTQVRRVRGDPPSVAAALADGAPTAGAVADVYLTPWTEERAAALAAPLAPSASPQPLPQERSAVQIAETHLAALGAALGLGGELGEALLSPAVAEGIRRRRRRSAVAAALAFVGAAVLALLASDAARAREAGRLRREAAALRARAESVLTLRAQLDTLDRRARAVAALDATRPDPVRVLRALGERLPRGVYLRLLRANGAEWEVSGFAPEASSLVPLLEQAPEFEGVRFLTAVASVRLDNRSYESFSLRFRVTPAP
jgi:hypothetical protein